MADVELHRSIGRLEGKMDQTLEELKAIGARFDKLDDRVNECQKKQWYHTGVMAVAGALAIKLGFPFPH